MAIDPSSPPTAPQALFGVVFWVALGAVFVAFMADEPRGNRIFLTVAAAMCLGFGAWRALWMVRAFRGRNRH